MCNYIFPAVLITKTRSSRLEVFRIKVFLKISQNSKQNTCTWVSVFIKLQAKACNFIKPETQALVFSCEFCEIFENTFFYQTPSVAASVRLPSHKSVNPHEANDRSFKPCKDIDQGRGQEPRKHLIWRVFEKS